MVTIGATFAAREAIRICNSCIASMYHLEEKKGTYQRVDTARNDLLGALEQSQVVISVVRHGGYLSVEMGQTG